MGFLGVLIRNLVAGPSTDPFPFGETFTPATLRGRVEYHPADCIACRACEQVCVGGAIRFDKGPEGLRFLLWHDSCTFCGLCAFYCPTEGITLSDDWHLAHPQSRKYAMVEEGTIPTIRCAACGAQALATAPAVSLFDHPPTSAEVEEMRSYCPRCRRKIAAERKAS